MHYKGLSRKQIKKSDKNSAHKALKAVCLSACGMPNRSSMNTSCCLNTSVTTAAVRKKASGLGLAPCKPASSYSHKMYVLTSQVYTHKPNSIAIHYGALCISYTLLEMKAAFP